jgi:hypothetical protein
LATQPDSQHEGAIMTRLLLLVVALAPLFFSMGCSTPAYSGGERLEMITRTWNYEGAQAMDDFDSLMLLRPPSRMTIWHVQ